MTYLALSMSSLLLLHILGAAAYVCYTVDVVCYVADAVL